MIKKKKRNSNLELYRILMMMLIIMHHYVVNSGLIEKLEEDIWSGNSIFFYIFGMWGRTAIDCFVLITGYYMCKSNITIRKFIKLLFQIEFYSVIIYLIFVFFGYQSFSLLNLFKTVWPFYGVKDDFATCFLLFYLFIPFMNILTKGMTKGEHQLLIVLCLSIYTILGSVPNRFVWMNYLTWFLILYIISSYMRLYPLKFDGNAKFWGGSFIVIISYFHFECCWNVIFEI